MDLKFANYFKFKENMNQGAHWVEIKRFAHLTLLHIYLSIKNVIVNN